mmetsp:Transcript_22713/g.69821  ORF Transcript_22713/g.69821 Transcript_22713/m.69821 type:complete len:201 (-) Transcript_22713:371-973(-)
MLINATGGRDSYAAGATSLYYEEEGEDCCLLSAKKRRREGVAQEGRMRRKEGRAEEEERAKKPGERTYARCGAVRRDSSWALHWSLFFLYLANSSSCLAASCFWRSSSRSLTRLQRSVSSATWRRRSSFSAWSCLTLFCISALWCSATSALRTPKAMELSYNTWYAVIVVRISSRTRSNKRPRSAQLMVTCRMTSSKHCA